MMTIEIPLTIAAGSGIIPRRWLVYQTRTDGTLVYAQSFVRRSSADRASQAANARRRLLTTRNQARVVRIPHDRRLQSAFISRGDPLAAYVRPAPRVSTTGHYRPTASPISA
jgi:hypothetical protein